jgi:hypothetical protein
MTSVLPLRRRISAARWKGYDIAIIIMRIFYRLLAAAAVLAAFVACDLIDPDTPDRYPVEKPDSSEEEEKPEEEDRPVISKIKKSSRTLEVSMNFTAEASSSSSRLYVALPCPRSNDYQDISNLETDGQHKTTDKGDEYLTWNETYERGSQVNHTSKVVFDYVTYGVSVDFSRIPEIYPYDTDSEIYRNYTSSSGEYIDPMNLTIKSIASSLWAKSSDVVDYAYKCYEYVASTYRYLNPNTGIHTLENNLKAGGGDCGNLSAIYISLLRNRNIPSRPVVCIRPDASFHVWSEFYLESYGWIPVDVTYKNSDPQGDYFGIYPGDGIVVSNEYDLLLEIGDETFSIPLLQTYAYWYRNMAGAEDSYKIKIVE